MEILTKEELEQKQKEYEAMSEEEKQALEIRQTNSKPLITMEDLNNIVLSDEPVQEQKLLVAKVKLFIDSVIARELTENGILSEFTRKWIRDYNDLLDKLHRNLYGDKSVNLHLHKVSHSDIVNKIKEFKNKE